MALSSEQITEALLEKRILQLTRRGIKVTFSQPDNENICISMKQFSMGYSITMPIDANIFDAISALELKLS